MCKFIPRIRPGGRCARAVVALVASLALGWTCIGDAVDRQPDAAQQPDTRQTIAELERSFWQCELAVSGGKLDAVTAAHCDAITDELKKRKFGGDFERLLQWWQENRLASLQRIEADRAAMRAA